MQNGGSNAITFNVSQKTQFFPNLVSTWEWNGLYVQGTAADQFEKLMQRIHCLSVAEAVVSLRNVKHSFQVKIAEVQPWWANDKDRDIALSRLIANLWELRDYYFCPRHVVEEDLVGASVVGEEPLDSPQSSNGHKNGVNDPPQITNGDGNGKANGHANGKGEKKSVFDF